MEKDKTGPKSPRDEKKDDKRPSAENDKPLIDEKPLAGKEPSAHKEPSAGKEPSADKKPSGGKEPSANREPSADKEPSAERKPSADQKPLTEAQAPAGAASGPFSVTGGSGDGKGTAATQPSKTPVSAAGSADVPPKTDSPKSSPPKHPPPKKPQKPVKKKRGKGLFLFLLLLLLVAAGYYGWYHYEETIRARLGLPAAESEPEFGPSTSDEQVERAGVEDRTAPPAPQQESPAIGPEASPGPRSGAESVRPAESAGPAEFAAPAESIEPADASGAQERQAPPEQTGPTTSQVARSVAAVQTRTERQGEELQALRDQIAELKLTLNSQQQRLRALSTTTREDWLLAEAEYLLRLANQRVLSEKQTENALSLMEAADNILKQMEDPDLYPVRKALAEDITALRVADAVDREGLYLKLDALVGVIPELTLPAAGERKREQAAANHEALPWYQRVGNNAWHALKDLSGIVRVEKAGAGADPRLLPSQAQMVRLNLRLALEQAQLALMREEQSIYDASLRRAIALVEENFAADRKTQVLLEELRALESRRVAADLPTLTTSIRALHNYISLWHSRYRVETPEPGQNAPAPTTEGEPTQTEGPAGTGGEQS